MLGPLEKGLLVLLLLVLMAGMGATLDWQQFRQVLRRPRALAIGVASQFGWMPLIAFALAKGLSLPVQASLGLMLVACTPGGTTSNLFTYYSRADLPLSISMTVVSTALAVVAMPLLLMVYAAPLTNAEMTVPYANIAVTMVLVLVPVAVGMWTRLRNPILALRIERFGSVSGVLVLVLLVGASLARNGADLDEIPFIGYVAAAGLGVAGMGLGYFAARVLGLESDSCRAVSLETGIQNSPLAFAIILTSFPESAHRVMLALPLVYALLILISASGVTLWFRRNSSRSAVSS